MDYVVHDGELYHYGVKGQKWGVRRYQNKDGGLTTEGKKHYGYSDAFDLEKGTMTLNDRIRFYDSKKSSARTRVRKDFDNDLDIKKHRDWLDEANRAYEKWYENEDPSKRETLKAEMERLNHEHPEAKKYERLRDSYIYDNASNRLKNAIDEAKRNGWSEAWTLEKHSVDHEYGALYDVYNSAYGELIFADMLKHSSDDYDDLYHWGIKGMRWGIRRYQTKDGSLTPAGRKRYNQDMEKIKAETKRLKNQQRTDAKLAKLEEAKKNLKDLKRNKHKTNSELDKIDDIEIKKAKILESRSPKALYENANLFTFNELNAAKMRLELERNIKNLEPPTVDKGKELTSNLTKNMDNVANIAQSGAKAYNSIAKIYNSMFGNKNGTALPLINDTASSKLDKFKEETEWIKAKNERKKADKEASDKKTDLDLLKEETARIDAENKNREAKRASRKHDESDLKEAKKAAEEAEKAAKEAEQKAAADKAAAAKRTQDLIDKYGDMWSSDFDSKANAGRDYVDWRTKDWEREEDNYFDWREYDWGND